MTGISLSSGISPSAGYLRCREGYSESRIQINETNTILFGLFMTVSHYTDAEVVGFLILIVQCDEALCLLVGLGTEND